MTIRSKDYRFFRDNAGYCVGQRAVGAIALARAEQAAQERDWEFVWEHDDDPELGDHAYWCADERREQAGYTSDGELEMHAHNTGGHEHEILYCALVTPEGERDYGVSLGGIIDPSDAYRRVIEAELALEALSYERDDERRSVYRRASVVAVAS